MTANRLPLSRAVDGFLLARTADGYSTSTIDQYRWALERMVGRVGEKSLSEVSVGDLRQFVVYLKEEYIPNRPNGDKTRLSDVSIFHAWKAIRAFYKWGSAEFGIDNVALRLSQPKHSYPEIAPFTEDDIKRLLKACERKALANTNGRATFAMERPTANRDKAIILALTDTGMRVTEQCMLNFEDYDMKQGEVYIRPRGSGVKSKGRTLPLGRSTQKQLWKYLALRELQPRDPIFVTGSGMRMTRHEILQLCKSIGRRAGVPNCNPHRFRHTFAIFYLRNSGDVFTLKKLLGHSSWKMVNHYLSLARADVHEAHRRASPVDNISGI
jgi:integrase/recombinase XerD